MSGWNNWGIRRKLFSIILLILVIQALVLLCAGSTLFEIFYTANKTAEMTKHAENIRDAYAVGSETFYDEIDTAEYENVVVALYTFDEAGVPQSIYHTRGNHDREDPWRKRLDLPPAPRENAVSNEMIERMRRADASFDVRVEIPQPKETNQGGKFSLPDGAITLVTKLDDNLYLNIFTSRGYIRSTADLAVKYTAQISLAILLLGSVAIYFVVRRVTRPISRIQEVADQIARLDFTNVCDVSGGDEIALLGQSINAMSQRLEGAITKLVSANEVLKSDLERQQNTERIRRQFIADVSHDFKTPLTLIVTYAEALSESKDEQAQEYCDIIISEGNRLSAMVGKLLELSRLENGADPVESSMFCLSEILDEAVTHHRLLTEKKSLTVTCTQEEAFIVQADYHKIVRVVINLFENAVKYTPEGGQIALRALREGTLCRLEIENDCEAPAPSEMEHLFDSFYRADKSRSSAQGSFGIGLATVRAIMEAHHMQYGAQLTQSGICFWIMLETACFEEDASDDDCSDDAYFDDNEQQ